MHGTQRRSSDDRAVSVRKERRGGGVIERRARGYLLEVWDFASAEARERTREHAQRVTVNVRRGGTPAAVIRREMISLLVAWRAELGARVGLRIRCIDRDRGGLSEAELEHAWAEAVRTLPGEHLTAPELVAVHEAWKGYRRDVDVRDRIRARLEELHRGELAVGAGDVVELLELADRLAELVDVAGERERRQRPARTVVH